MAGNYICPDAYDHSGQTSSDLQKRAVLRSPPRKFSVEFIPCVKSNSSTSFVHGMRIVPDSVVASSAESTSSRSAGRATSQYEIWRRWEDILFFHVSMAEEYKKASMDKKRALAKGKGVKNLKGTYKQDFASSWDSLPPGPDPKSVVDDLGKILPPLTKKGSIFRPSLSAIEARQAQFKVYVEALISPEMPSLVKELRREKSFLDFFGLWRRDYDLLKKTNPKDSLHDSVFNTYFTKQYSPPTSSSSLSLRLSRSSISSKPSRRLSIESDSTVATSAASSQITISATDPSPPSIRQRVISSESTSSDSSSSQSGEVETDMSSVSDRGSYPLADAERHHLSSLLEEDDESQVNDLLKSRPRRTPSEHMESQDGQIPDEPTSRKHIPPVLKIETTTSSISTLQSSRFSTRSSASQDGLSALLSPDSLHSAADAPVSPTSTIASSSSRPVSTSGPVNVKVAYDDAIVMIRVDRHASLEELRKKVYAKFVGQEGLVLPDAFDFVYTPAPLSLASPNEVKGRNSTTLIQEEGQWSRLVFTFTGSKLNFRVVPKPD